MVYKNIRVKMKGGKTRLQRVKVLKSGKYKFVKNLGKKLRRKVRRRSSNPKRRRVRKTARRRRRRRSSAMTIPLAPVAGLAAGMAQPVQKMLAGDFTGAIDKLIFHYTGMAGYAGGPWNFNAEGLKQGLLPLVMGLMVHKFVGGPPLNANRILARHKVPFIRI